MYKNGGQIMAGTIQEIADLAGVSRGTVDRALNNRGRINQEVADRILQIAEEIGYAPRQKKKGKTIAAPKIGVVTQLANASFMVRIREGLEDAHKELMGRGIELFIEDCMTVSEEEQLAALTRLEEQHIAGVAIMPVESEKVRQKLNEMTENGIASVTFNTDIVGTKRSCFVGLDNRKSGRTAAGLMGILTGGTGKILAITGYFGNSVNSMRLDGFVEEIKKSCPHLDLVGVHSGFDKKEEVEKIVTQTLEVYPDLSGIVIFSSGQEGVINALRKKGPDNRPAVIIYDLTANNSKALEEGMADFLIDQNGYTQGYRALMNLADIVQRGQEPDREYFYTDIIIKNKYNI